MLARLERSVGEHQRFAANASHELRTPIATTQTLLDIALTDPDLDLPTLRAAAERVREMNQRNRETVDALLSLAEADAGALQLTSVSVDAIVLEAVRGEQSTADEFGLRVEATAETAFALGDETLLRQAVANLVQNAVRHNERGGLVEVDVRRTGDVVVVRVENTGAVLREDIVVTLTEPFVRAQGRVAGGRKGHGLGLALVRSVAEAHHGALVVRAHEGGGLEVELRLPALVGAASGPDTDAIDVTG